MWIYPLKTYHGTYLILRDSSTRSGSMLSCTSPLYGMPTLYDGALYRVVFNLALHRLSRISLTLSVARIFLPGHRYRIYAFVFISILFLMYLTSILITTFSCPGSPWWNLDYTTCVSASKKADTSIIVGVASKST